MAKKLTKLEVKKLNKKLIEATTPRLNKYIPHKPFPQQAAFMLLPQMEAFFGGSAGGGKSDVLLMIALQYMDTPNSSALVLRRSYKDLSQPAGMLTRAREWLAPFINSGEVKWKEKKSTFVFPNNSYLMFGHLDNDSSKYNFQGGEYQTIIFDELTQISIINYKYLLSRLRRTINSETPLRVRSAANPGGRYHAWVKSRFVDKSSPRDNIYLPSRLSDNKFINTAEYTKALNKLDPITREQLLNGDWELRQAGDLFNREWFNYVEQVPAHARYVRFWDLASSVPRPEYPDPDWTSGTLMARYGDHYYIVNIVRFRLAPGDVKKRIQKQAQLDGHRARIRIEQEGGSAGLFLIDNYINDDILKTYDIKGVPTTGTNKELRAAPLSVAASNLQISIVVPNFWANDFFEEIETFGTEACLHDDQIDSTGGAYLQLVSVKSDKNSVPTAGTKVSKWINRR